MIRAVTFDFWDTLAIDDSDEPKRAARGLPSKADARRSAFSTLVGAGEGARTVEDALRAWEEATRWCLSRWRSDAITPTVSERLDHGLGVLGLDRPATYDAIVAELEGMELVVSPDPVPGAAEILEALSGRYRLGIISDTIYSPGTSLRRLLDEWGMLRHLEVFVFSDEIGCSKPARAAFQAALGGFGVPAGSLVHVGDREDKDIRGAHGAGAHGVLYTGVVDRRPEGESLAAGTCERYEELPEILAGLGGRS